MPWKIIEASLAHRFQWPVNADKKIETLALFGPEIKVVGVGSSQNSQEVCSCVKVGVASTLRSNLIVGARSFPHNPYDGHTLQEQLEQASILSDSTIKEVIQSINRFIGKILNNSGGD